ncbi:MAG TPA: response regulator [Bacteroidia bacterium]
MKKKVLIVEDDKVTQELISFKFKREGFEVQTADNGWDALEFVNREKVDLIVSDIMMPHISGLSLLSLINRFYYANIPVIMISSLDKDEVVMSAMGLGANDFLRKPLNFSVLVKRIKKLLNIKGDENKDAKKSKK